MTSQAGDFAEAAACAASMAGVSCASVVPKSTCRATLEVLTLLVYKPPDRLGDKITPLRGIAVVRHVLVCPRVRVNFVTKTNT